MSISTTHEPRVIADITSNGDPKWVSLKRSDQTIAALVGIEIDHNPLPETIRVFNFAGRDSEAAIGNVALAALLPEGEFQWNSINQRDRENWAIGERIDLLGFYHVIQTPHGDLQWMLRCRLKPDIRYRIIDLGFSWVLETKPPPETDTN
jgi:hypothetical protein